MCVYIIIFQTSYSDMAVSTPASVDQALSSLKSVLSEVVPHTQLDPNVLFGNCYVISTEEDQGLVWNKLCKDIATQVLGIPVVSTETLKETSFFKVILFLQVISYSQSTLTFYM